MNSCIILHSACNLRNLQGSKTYAEFTLGLLMKHMFYMEEILISDYSRQSVAPLIAREKTIKFGLKPGPTDINTTGIKSFENKHQPGASRSGHSQ